MNFCLTQWLVQDQHAELKIVADQLGIEFDAGDVTCNFV